MKTSTGNELQYFQNHGTLSCLGAVSSCPVLPGLALFGFLVILIKSYFFNKYKYPFHTFHIILHPPRSLPNPITASVPNSQKHVWEWFNFGHMIQSIPPAIQEGYPLVLKITVH